MPAPRKNHTQPRSRGTAKRLTTSATVQGMPAADDGAWPALPASGNFLPETVAAWAALGAEPQAQQLTGAQRIVARRWIEAFDAYLRALELVKNTPMVQGSTGQPVVNPLWGVVASREAAMEKAERQLGVGLKNKADLGLTIGQAKLTAQQLNDMYRGGRGDESESAGELEAAGEVEGVDEGWAPAE